MNKIWKSTTIIKKLTLVYDINGLLFYISSQYFTSHYQLLIIWTSDKSSSIHFALSVVHWNKKKTKKKIVVKSNSKPKLPNIRIFQSTNKYLAILGISSNLLVQPHPFNRNISIGFLIMTSALICNFVYVIFEDETFWEFTQSIYFCSDSLVCTLSLSILVFRANKLYKFIVSLENAINASECEFRIKYTFAKILIEKKNYPFSVNILSSVKRTH